MLVSARGHSGDWTIWRVGRRRLAWRPRYVGWHFFADFGPDWLGLILLLINVVPGIVWLVNWLCCLLVSAVVWPWRVLTGRWPVVAYPVDNGGPDDGFYRENVRGRVAANALARQWAEKIKQVGHPYREPVVEPASSKGGFAAG